MVLGLFMAVTNVPSTYQCAEIASTALGRRRDAPMRFHSVANSVSSIAFIGLPCPMNKAGMRSNEFISLSLRASSARGCVAERLYHPHTIIKGSQRATANESRAAVARMTRPRRETPAYTNGNSTFSKAVRLARSARWSTQSGPSRTGSGVTQLRRTLRLREDRCHRGDT